ncbi:MAG TPA: hypothetical protein VH165_02615 [Kofleriaceae bacterium]|nr:hypothetical protein [Kofleriaceae bacterium]
MRPALFLGLGIVLTACGGGPQRPSVAPASPRSSPPVSNAAPASSEPAAPPSQEPEAAIVKMQQLSDAMCTCADKPCSERVIEEMTQWGRAMVGRMDKVTQDQAQQLTAIGEHMTQCLRKLSPKLSPAPGGSATP